MEILKRIMMITVILIIAYCTKSYCAEEGTVRMKINNGAAWINIDVSNAYNECEKLNSSSSTLGTPMLKAHLTTDQDWSAMALFSVSQYGGARSNTPSPTNSNASGIYGVSTRTFTTGILETATSTSTVHIKGLFNEDGSLKKYMKAWPTSREDTNFVGFLKDEGTWGWYNSNTYWGTSTAYPISVKSGLFGVFFGFYGIFASGAPSDNTFRPVIWN